MFQWIKRLTVGLGILCCFQVSAMAWEQYALPQTSVTSMTAHYGGSKAPLVRSGLNIVTGAVSDLGAQVFWSSDDGVNWQADALNAPSASQVVVLSDQLAVSWGLGVAPRLHTNPSAIPGGWSSTPQAWPLASWNILDVDVSASGDVWLLVTIPDVGHLSEGALYLVRGNTSGWVAPVSISQGSVGDATLVKHASGLWTAVWSERDTLTTWKVAFSNSSDGATWTTAMNAVTGVVAPPTQEAGVQIAADALPSEGLALAFTGWESAPHSQLWSKSIDVNSGTVLTPKTLLPDAGDMVYQPSLVVLGASRWAVVWQQKKEIDHEILMAEHRSNGTWSNALNMSVDPWHVDRDPHVGIGASHELVVVFTRRMIPDVQESYIMVEGNITDVSLDSDGDGIPNAEERGLDLDANGVDDAYSSITATWLGMDGRYTMQLLGGGNLADIQAVRFDDMGVLAPSGHQVVGNMFSFQIINVAVGGTAQVHISVPTMLSADVKWMKWNNGNGWTEASGTVVDADGMGMTITLVDGGMGDEDGIANGQILDPAVFATPQAAGSSGANSGASSAASGGGCVMSASNSFDPIFILLLLVSLLGVIRKSYHD